METINVFTRDEFRRWLSNNHDKETKVSVILYKKHTGKSSPSHRELIEEAICFGWIDTTVKRLDEERYTRNFTRRTKNSRWSDNTISYAKELLKKKMMAPQGIKYYKEGLKKPTHDAGIPKSPDIPEELKKALSKNKKANDNFQKYPASLKRMLYRWILRAKRKDTVKKRVKLIVERVKEGRKDIMSTQEKVNS